MKSRIGSFAATKEM